jgi:hypothetical protein
VNHYTRAMTTRLDMMVEAEDEKLGFKANGKNDR